jgi:thiol-disulfide isomerase/thioredoxin
MNLNYLRMRTLLVLLAAFCFVFWTSPDIAAEYRPHSHEYCPFVFSTHPNVAVKRILLGETSTTLDMVVYGNKGYWIRISSDTYINADGKKYKIQSSDGIALDQEVYPGESGIFVFSLIFPPIDPATQQLDFIESDCDNCFKIYGLLLKPDMQIKRASVPKKIKDAAIIKDDGKPLPAPKPKAGKAVLKGTLLGYVPAINTKINVYVDNPVTGIQEELGAKVREDGRFELEVPLVTTMEVLLRLSAPWYNKYILLSPGKESSVYFDLPQRNCQETPVEALKCPPAKYIYFGGANAEINNQMEDLDLAGLVRQKLYSQDYNIVAGMTAEEYKSCILDKLSVILDELAQKGLTKKALEFASMSVRFNAIYRLMFTENNLREAYRRSHNLDYNDPLTGFTPPVIDSAFYSFLRDYSVNDPYLLYFHDGGYIINSCKYLETREFMDIEDSINKDGFQELIDSGKLKPEELYPAVYMRDNDVATIQDFLSGKTEANNNISREQVISFLENHSKEISLIWERRTSEERKSHLANILGADRGVVFDLLETQRACAKMKEFTLLTADELQAFSKMENPFYFRHLTAKNKELSAQIEANKRKGGYTIHQTPDTEGEQAFSEIIKKFEGKVILVDFWNTWCGPCLSAMKRFEPSKSTFKEKGVVFIYLADESSPINTWNNAVTSIGGEHFRLNNSQMSEIKKKFGIRGIPSYLILNKQGEQIYFQTGFDGEAIKKKLEEAMF